MSAFFGRFSDSRKPALALRAHGDYKVFLSTIGNLSHTVLRQIAKQAGVHIYAEDGTFTYVSDSFVGVYNTGAEETVVTLPCDGEYEELFSGKVYRTENKKSASPQASSLRKC